MSAVKLYVYDLSRGMAKSMSLGLTGKQIDGIWHTSVVVFGREVFYGRGIMEAAPGTTHHGQPLQIIDVGETHIDAETFQEYLFSLSELYTASAYHLTDFNCNNFTADVVGFLTGAEIPSWISGLPSEFLATPFGQALRPTIDAMFRQSNEAEKSAFGGSPAAAATPAPRQAAPAAAPQPTPQDLAAALLGAVAQQAAGGSGPTSAPPKPGPTTAALTLVTSRANFTSILKNNTAVVANFTNTAGCPPCRAIKPAYETIAENNTAVYGHKGTRFVEVELDRGDGQSLAEQYGVTATPTFIFFKDGKQVDVMRGADKRGLENRVEAFLDDCFPQHPHKRLYLAVTSKLSTEPILATATPAFPALVSKIESFGVAGSDLETLKKAIAFLQAPGSLNDAQLGELLTQWTNTTKTLLAKLKPEQTFPLIDLWRIALLNTRVAAILTVRLSPTAPGAEPINAILALVASQLKERGGSTPRPLVLTALRLSTNLLGPLPLANLVLASGGTTLQSGLLTLLVDSLLHPEVSVRKAAADVAVNAAAWRHRLAKERAAAEGVSGEDDDGIEAEWEVEGVSALLEAIGREEDADVGHRLLVATALLLYLAPSFVDSLQPLLEVLGAKETVEAAGKRWGKKDVRKLADEVATKLC
ncbi:hypothetical protein Q8F55_007648 [Vanrija albida]|uniref:PPPDE domain-containing protein n=1 Tax=Vanrija albida TaxID=181172 RepID=A0ABR3PU54_9TREE